MEAIDWARIFGSDTPLLEIFVRGTAVYLSLFLLLRFVMRREAGALGLTDLLVIVLIADAAQNAMADDYHSVTDGVFLVMVILGWSFLLSWLASRHAFWRRVVLPPRVQLVRDGQILRRNLDRELITEEELMGELRGHGIDKLDKVRAAYMESDGMISVIRRGKDGEDAPRKRRGV
jgi:uncharacterized membrane protein YcaP (DUF421 family)